MMKELELESVQLAQQFLFQQIRDRLPAHLSLVEEIEEVLSISSDSAYRRIRGEKELSLGELQKLVSKYGISLNQALNVNSDSEVSFRYNPINPVSFTMKDYLNSAYRNVKVLRSQGKVHMIYAAKDIPIFHYFFNDELAIFKIFVWQKSLLGFPEYAAQKFSFDNYDPEVLEIGRNFLKEYNSFDSTELWNTDTVTSALNQIEFYCEAGLFQYPKDALMIIDKLEEYLLHMHRQAETGRKFSAGEVPSENSGTFEMYNNEIVRSDNTIVATFGDEKVTFLTHCGINFLATFNRRFCETTHTWLINLMKRSSLISLYSEKQRSQFFGSLFGHLNQTRERVKYIVG